MARNDVNKILITKFCVVRNSFAESKLRFNFNFVAEFVDDLSR